MKNLFTILLTGLMIVGMTIQSHSQGFQFGIKGLANVSSIHGLDDTGIADAKSKITTGVGLFATIKISKIGVQPELQLLKQGSKFEDSGGTEYNQKMTYFKVPVMINFYIIKQLHLEAGPYFGILLAAEQKLTSDPLNLGTGPIDNKDNFKSTDVGLAAGIGADIKRLNLSFRYMLGLTDINDFTPSSGTAEKLKNGIFQFGIGISIINKD